MSAQRFYQLVVSFGILTAIAFITERSHVLASIVSVMPLNITVTLWFLSSRTDSSAALSADFSRLLYATYLGGSKRDDLRASFLDAKGRWYVAGESSSADWPTKNATQATFAGQADNVVAALTRAP